MNSSRLLPANSVASASIASDLTRTMVAYFSMEIGIDPAVPTYAGGLGVLAGDFVRAAADAEHRLLLQPVRGVPPVQEM